MLDITNIDVYHGRICALKGLSLRVEKGEIVAIIGANGAGKTTILHSICGILHPKKGTIKFKGERIDNLASHQITKRGIALVPQGRRLFGDQTVMDNLLLGSYSRKRTPAIQQEIRNFFENFPLLKNREKQIASRLSGGQQQILAIGRAIMAGPTLMLFDEPSMGLAPVAIDTVFQTIKTLNSRGITILIVEQLAGKTLEIASRGYVLANGRVVLEGTSEELLQNESVKEAYLPKVKK